MKKTLAEHLEELRRRLLVSLAAVLAAAVGSFFYSESLLRILAQPILKTTPEVYFFSPADAFVMKIQVSLLSGLVLASPIVFGELWKFISPGLYPHEKKWILPFIFVTTGLFVSGVLFSFYQVIPVALSFFLEQGTPFLRPMVSMTEYVSFLSGMVIAFGAAFILPVVVVGAVAAGAFSVKQLNAFQRHAVILIFIASAILTPTPDIASQLLLAVPLLFLFELSVAAAWAVEVLKKRRKSARVNS